MITVKKFLKLYFMKCEDSFFRNVNSQTRPLVGGTFFLAYFTWKLVIFGWNYLTSVSMKLLIQKNFKKVMDNNLCTKKHKKSGGRCYTPPGQCYPVLRYSKWQPNLTRGYNFGRLTKYFKALDVALGQVRPTHHLGPELLSLLKENRMGLARKLFKKLC